MKKIICGILAALLCLSFMPAFAGNQVIFENYDEDDNYYYVNGFMFANDTAYIISNSAYFTWNSSEGLVKHAYETPVLQEDDAIGYVAGYMTDGEKLYARVTFTLSDEDYNSFFDSSRMYEITPDGDAGFVFSNPVKLDYEDMVYEGDGYSYEYTINNAFISGGRLVYSTVGDYSGNTTLGSFDIATGERYETEMGADYYVCSMCDYKDGKALIATSKYEDGKENLSLFAFDYMNEDFSEIGQFVIDDSGSSTPASLAYDETTDTLYYTRSGQAFYAAGCDIANSVSLCSCSMGWSEYPSVVNNGRYFVNSYDGVLMINTDPNAQPTKSLTIDSKYNDCYKKAVSIFTAQNPDVDVILNDDSYNIDVIKNMMNQYADIDVYTLNMNSTAYAALFERGYMAELNSSKALTEYIDSLYPAYKDAVTKDGQIFALPIYSYNTCVMVNRKELEKLGYTEDKLPKTWEGLFSLAAEMSKSYDTDSSYKLFYDWYTIQDMKSTLTSSLFSSYFAFLKYDKDLNMSFDTDALRNAFAALEQIDFAGCGLPESYEDYDNGSESGDVSSDSTDTYDDRPVLFSFDSSFGIYSFSGTYDMTPLPLAFTENEEPSIWTNVTAVVLNPYSTEIESAIKYLESVVTQIYENSLYEMSPNLSEPVPNKYFEENKQWYEDQIKSIEEELAKAVDETEIKDWQSQYDSMKEQYDQYLVNGQWDISKEGIEAYRQYAISLKPVINIGVDESTNSEMYSFISDYSSGAITSAEMLKKIDAKLQMMLKEGL